MGLDCRLAQMIIEHLDAATVGDAEGRYVYVNKGWLAWMDMQPEEVLGKYVKDIVPNSKIEVAFRGCHEA